MTPPKIHSPSLLCPYPPATIKSAFISSATRISSASTDPAEYAVVLTVTFTPSLIVRAQGTQRFEYVRVTPYIERIPIAANAIRERFGYRACVAQVNGWACREFSPTEPSTDALRNMFVNLGIDGWELVSAVEEDPSFANQFGTNGLTYLFKRQGR